MVELGSHRLRDLVAPVSVVQVGDAAFPPLRSLDYPQTNLPAGLTELVGRADDIAAVAAQVRRDRIVTLTGVGGVGKTRLALAVAEAVANDFFDGAWLVELAPVPRGGEVATTAMTALATPRVPGCDSVASLLAYLADRRLVLVLDNCEHLLDQVAELVEAVTSTTRDIHVLATSREPLRVEGEVVRGVRSLDVGDEVAAAAVAAAGAEAVEAVEAVRLFVDRARAASGQFVLDDSNVDAVAAICRQLDGVPLAIELAAARVRTMTPADIAARLHDRFGVLTGGRRSHERHRTLLATVTWSYDLLSTDERQVFAQLAVFASSFDLDAAAAVVRVDGLGKSDVVDVLLRLVDRSLVVHDRACGRYRLLETLRQFASDRLAETGAAATIVERYTSHYTRVVGETAAGIDDHRHDAAVATLAAELDNIRATIDLLLRAEQWRAVGKVSLAGWRFFTQFTPLESNAWLAAALDGGGLPDPAQQADAAAAMAMMAANTGAGDEAKNHGRRALDLAARGGFPEPPWARFALAMVATMFESDWDACLDHSQAAVIAASTRGAELARIAAVAQTVPPLLRCGRRDEADAAATEAVEAAARFRNTTALSLAVIFTCSAYCFGTREGDARRALDVLDRHGDAAIGPYGGLNAAWVLTYRAIAESGRYPRRAVGYAVRAARIADRSSAFAVAGAVHVLALASARAGQVAEASALVAFVEASGVMPFGSSDAEWLRTEVSRAIAAGGPVEAPVPVPSSRRELLALLANLDGWASSGDGDAHAREAARSQLL